jgi:hypothetical protein
MRLVLILALVAVPTAAIARPITSPTDPALTGALTATFDSLTPTSRISLQTTIGTPPDTVTITATTTPASEVFYGACPAQPNGCIFSWTAAAIGTDAPVTIAFDQPIAAIAITRNGNCYSDTAIEVTSATGVESTMQVCAGGQAVFSGVAEVGEITQVRLTGDSTWDNLMVVRGGGTPPAAADLAAGTTHPIVARPSTTASFGLSITNLGPGPAHAPELYALPPFGVALVSGDPYGHWSFPDLADAQTIAQQVDYVTPAPAMFSCGTLHPVALTVSTTQDAVPANNLVLSALALDPAARLPQVCAPGADDSDCDGQSGCWDSECVGAPACARTWPELIPNLPLDDFWPPIVLPLDDPGADPGTPEQRDPDANPPCQIPIHGVLTAAPPYCCTSLIVVPEAVRWHDCHALDPNAIEADVATDSRGFGLAAAGAPFGFTIHYENIGGADAHDVRVLLVLDDGFDASTLAVADGGSYDAATRTLQWIDPVVFPHDPRAVHFTVTASAALVPTQHLRSQATVVFPDAFPPSRIDTNALVHVVPSPRVPLEPDLVVFGCERVGDATYKVRLTNRGFGFALAAHATLVEPAPGVVVIDGTAAFANPRDIDPTMMATVTPISTTRSLDTIEVRGGGDDPCEAAHWQLDWRDVTGAAHTAVVQAYADRDGDGIADYRVAPSDTGCCGAGGDAPGAALLVGGALLGRRRRRPAAG